MISLAVAALEVFGLAFGQRLSLPECGRDPALPRSYAVDQLRLCTAGEMAPSVPGTRGQTIQFPRKEIPIVMGGKFAEAILLDDNLAGVRFDTLGVDSQDVVFEELAKKFGKPSSEQRLPMQTRTGVKIYSIHATWVTPEADIVFDGAPRRIDLGSVEIFTHRLRSIQRAAEGEENRRRTPL